MYEFSLTSLVWGIIILMVGVIFVRYYQWVADNFGGGVGSYERYRFLALATCGLGFIVMSNLHVVILRALLGSLFPSF